MNVDYFTLLTTAVAGKGAAERDKIYRDARGLIARSNLTREAAALHVSALEAAVQRIESDLASEELNQDESTAAAELLSPGIDWKRVAVIACAIVAVIGLSVVLYQFLAGKRGSATASRGREEIIMPDLKPGVDGGSSAEGLPFALQRQVVFYRTTVIPGSIVVDRENRFLYLIDSNNSARRYGIGIARECLKSGTLYRVTNKLEWPEWKPASAATAKETAAFRPLAGGPGNPFGARALVMDKPDLLIHGTNSPKTIGHLVASGCIRLVNEDVEDLYRRVSLETRVIFVS
ncbi:L,D-transpeptidase [Afipia massiliensis]|uniref:L,D-transpeptidase n=1 Tax=Afipia massiliensis TaxID=211460 RepID=A0A4V6BDP4_9BRAD|nr:L,D-transpeptidase [Afipia massiliensis]TKT70493.1 L,D-transpeptidase [Afipia massiliensis]